MSYYYYTNNPGRYSDMLWGIQAKIDPDISTDETRLRSRNKAKTV